MDADGKQAALARAAKDESLKVITKSMTAVAERILSLEAEALSAAESAVTQAGVTIRARSEVGRLLTEMKGKIGHGNWLTWLNRNLSDLSASGDPASVHRLAQKRMELYNRVRDGIIKIDDARSVREAYLLADLLPDSSRSEPSCKAIANGDDLLLVRLTRLSGALQSEIQRQPVTEWPDERKQVWRERLEPIAKLYAQIS